MNLKEKSIVIDNKTYRYSKIVMLATNNKSGIGNIYKKIKDSNIPDENMFVGKLCLNINPYVNESNDYFEAQHLYFLSTDKIKENTNTFNEGLNGDWFYNSKYKTIQRTGDITELDFKIIASTDSSLNLPKPSEQFLQIYINAFNKGEKIEECLVEYNKFTGCDENGIPMDQNGNIFKNIPKVTKGEITIRKIKDSFSREEVEDLCRRAIQDHCGLSISHQPYNESERIEMKDKWIEQNL